MLLCLRLAARHCLDVSVHRDADIGMAHQFLRRRHVRALALYQCSKCMTKRVPTTRLVMPARFAAGLMCFSIAALGQ